MSNANEIKQHLKAVEQTRKITNAMYLLSTSRMKKAMSSIDFNLFYLQRLRTTIKDILSKTKNNNLTFNAIGYTPIAFFYYIYLHSI